MLDSAPDRRPIPGDDRTPWARHTASHVPVCTVTGFDHLALGIIIGHGAPKSQQEPLKVGVMHVETVLAVLLQDHPTALPQVQDQLFPLGR